MKRGKAQKKKRSSQPRAKSHRAVKPSTNDPKHKAHAPTFTTAAPEADGARDEEASADTTAPPPYKPFAFPIVGIGASAGGLEACSQLLRAIPADVDFAVIVVQHLAPEHE